MEEKPTTPVVDHSRRCKFYGDVVVLCSCFMDFIDDPPEREGTLQVYSHLPKPLVV